jgi:hypothetical protein
MIVWSGKGILSALVLLVTLVLLFIILPATQGNLAFILALFTAAIFSWTMGKKWNGAEGTVVIDKATGREMVIKSNHTLFWIKMEYWGVVFGLMGLVILIQQFV